MELCSFGTRSRAAAPVAPRLCRAVVPAVRRHLLLAAGRLEEQKGFDILVRAMTGVLRAFPDTKLALAGEGPGKELLERSVTELNLTGAVSLHPFQNDLAEWIQAADVVVVPS